MNGYRVIALQPVDVDGHHYESGEALTINGLSHGILLVHGVVKLDTSPIADPPKRKRGRPRKTDTTAPSYQRRDLQAEE